MKRFLLPLGALGVFTAMMAQARVVDAARELDIRDLSIKGHVADRFEDCVRNHVLKTDATYLSRIFKYQEDVGNWQTEFWGKYMHSAVPVWQYTGDAELKARIDRSVADIESYQLPDGYIGNYAEGGRSDRGWDVWGNKYTMLGLLHYYDATGDRKALETCRRLCDYLIATFGPGKRDLHKTGCYRGLPSGSVLEPVVWLFERTQEKKYLDFATYVVSELNDADSTARLIRDALAGVDVGDRVTGTNSFWLESSKKAYEMMSCYQGLLEYYQSTGRKDCLDATVAAAKSIATTEVNIAGGSSAHENWYHGRKNQVRTFEYEQETCVVTTWLRLCEKLLALTGDAFWADEMEKCFYNAYLASMRRDGGYFIQYNPLAGTRHAGEDQCRLHTNCCNANGPRGFLAFLRACLMAQDDVVFLNFFTTGTLGINLPSDGTRITLEGYTHYPKTNDIHYRYRSEAAKTFTLKIRIPSWSRWASVKVNGKDVKDVKAGAYLAISREWKPGDHLDVQFDLSPRMHEVDGYVAFTAGPVALARDVRFNDGPLDEVVNQRMRFDQLVLRPVRTVNDELWITYAGFLNLGTHHKNWNEKLPNVVQFCDYASAGNTWSPASAYRVWLPREQAVKNK